VEIRSSLPTSGNPGPEHSGEEISSTQRGLMPAAKAATLSITLRCRTKSNTLINNGNTVNCGEAHRRFRCIKYVCYSTEMSWLG